MEDDADEFAVVEAILDKRSDGNGGIEYLVRWEGSDNEDAWIQEEDAVNCGPLFAEFERSRQEVKPVRIIGRSVEKGGKIMYSILWSDGEDSKSTQQQEAASAITDETLLEMIENFDITAATSASLANARTSTRSTRNFSKSSASVFRDKERRSSARQAENSGNDRATSRASLFRKKRRVVEDSEDEKSVSEDGNYVSGKEDHMSAHQESEDNESNNNDDGDNVENSDSSHSGRSDTDEMDEDESDKDSEDDGTQFSQSIVAKHKSHQQYCLRCGMADEKKRRKGKDNDLIGSVGDLLPCSTCAATCHALCRTKPSKKEKDGSAARAANIGFSVSDYQCPDCFSVAVPSCLICSKLAYHDESKLMVTETETPSEEKEAENHQPRLLKSSDVTPLFRCQRCKYTAHLPCLTKMYPASSYKTMDHRPESRYTLGSAEFYTQHWTCFDCYKWRHKVEGILTFRDFAAVHSTLDTPPSNALIEREYYVKFASVSNRWNEWVPARWIEGQRDCATRLNYFLRDKVPRWQTMSSTGVHSYIIKQAVNGVNTMRIEGVLDMDNVCAEKILDVKFSRSCKADIRTKADEIIKLDLEKHVDSVFVKWFGLGYESCTWEAVPNKDAPETVIEGDRGSEDKAFQVRIERDMRASFVKAFEDWKRRNVIGTVGEKRKEKAKPRFKEYKEQPDFIVGGSLKDYQIDGLNWLMYKWYKNTPCILADEMGLGKTLQIVAFISALFKEQNQYPFLILAPSITIGHWLDEFRKWAPDMVVVHYTGTKIDRTMIRDHEIFRPKNSNNNINGGFRFHVLMSSYESMMTESGFFKGIPFSMLVCDEGHRLKNDESRTFRQLMSNIQVRHKVVLSGTPLQNNMRELFNLLHFLDPEKYSDPENLASKFGIENIKEDDTIIPKIHDFLRPMFLRRTKEEVLTFLPPKAEILVPVPLTAVQKEMYKAILAKNFSLLRSIGVQSGASETKAVPLKNILMELRKICNHPYLGTNNLEPPGTSQSDLHKLMVDASGKFSLLQPMLRKLFQRGHRVLIFSQFKIVLDIVEDFLNGEEYKYMRIDGETATSKRHDMITEFNAPNSPHFIFLLTTRTGGTGINLTSADTIIIYDSDWNPHQDIQAVARVHRIGQTKPVLIYKLFTRDTVEASIIERSTSKLVLDKIVVGAMDEENVDTKELSSILKVGAKKLFEESDDAAQDSVAKFDDAAIERLIDRDRIIAEEVEKKKAMVAAHESSKDVDADDNSKALAKPAFSFAKVWILDEKVAAEDKKSDDGGMTDADPLATGESGMEESDENFWEKLLQGRIESSIQPLEDSTTLGKRRRKDVNYRETLRVRGFGATDKAVDDAVGDIYEPEVELSSAESGSDFSEVEEDAGVLEPYTSKLDASQWVPWMNASNCLDPFAFKPYSNASSQIIAKRRMMRYVTFKESHCESLNSNSDVSSLRFKVKIVNRLLAKAVTLTSSIPSVPPEKIPSKASVNRITKVFGTKHGVGNGIHEDSAPLPIAPQDRETVPVSLGQHPLGETIEKAPSQLEMHGIRRRTLDENTLKKINDFGEDLRSLRQFISQNNSAFVPTKKPVAFDPAFVPRNATEVVDLTIVDSETESDHPVANIASVTPDALSAEKPAILSRSSFRFSSNTING
ncbi:hypothetical protein HDU81_002538 [Chytriomyces hyalinus]|nr:hypothetical protein HDU81_002538 [Chytriomyces hyalinus]